VSEGTESATARVRRPSWLPTGIDPAVLPAAAVSIVVALGFGLVAPILPLYARSFGVSAAQVGLLVSAFAFVRLVSDLPAGKLVGWIGAARATALGTAMVAVSSAAAGLASTFALLVLFRSLGGVGSALFSTGLMGYLLAVVPRERMGRAMSAFNGSFLLGSAFGPAVGGLAAGVLGLQGPFFLYAGFCAAASVVALLLLRAPAGERGGADDTSDPAGRHAVPPSSGAGATVGEAPENSPPLRPSRALAAALSGGFALWWLLGGFRYALVPLYAQEQLGLDSLQIGLGVTASAVANVLILYPAGLAADRVGRRAVGVPAFAGLAVAAGALLLADGLGGYVLANVLFGLVYATASIVPGTLLADATPPGRSGLAAGLSNAASDLGNVLGPVAVGAVLDVGGYPAALGLAALPAVVAAGAIALSRPVEA